MIKNQYGVEFDEAWADYSDTGEHDLTWFADKFDDPTFQKQLMIYTSEKIKNWRVWTQEDWDLYQYLLYKATDEYVVPE